MKTNAFYNCKNLTTIDFPSLVSAGTDAFRSCTSLKNVNLPLYKHMEDHTFRDCTSLEELHLPSLEGICSYCMNGCSNLHTIDAPNVTYFGYMPFNGARITKAIFPLLQSTGTRGFARCWALVETDFSSLPTVNNYDFEGCSSLVKLDFPVVSLIKVAGFSGCGKLTTLILRNNVLCTLENTNAFQGTPIKSGTGYIYVPDDLVDSYKTATNWSVYANQIKPLSEYVEEGVEE